MSRLWRPLRRSAVHRRMPRPGRRLVLRRGDRRRRRARGRGDDLRREHPRRDVRAGVPGRGSLRRAPACSLTRAGDRSQIAALQRFATDQALECELPIRRPAPPTGRRVAVVGAGPAGLACAGELAARGHSVTVFEARDEIGGLVRFAIAPYRIEREPLSAEQRALEALGVRFELGASVTCLDRLAGYDAVFLGVGLGADVELELPGSDLPGVWESLPFIEALKTGTPPAVGRNVVVIGGGNTAIDVARESLRLGAASVTIAYRRTALRHAGLRVRGRGGGTGRRAVRLACLAGQAAGVGSRHRRRMHLDAGSAHLMRAAAAAPNRFPGPSSSPGRHRRQGDRPAAPARALERFGGFELARGLIEVDESGRTSNRRVYAGGDAVERRRERRRGRAARASAPPRRSTESFR